MGHRKESILLVDDESSILDVAEEYFRIRGYEVFTATNGAEALRILQSHRVDCCFTDINMPEMDGVDLAESIRRNDNSIPVVIITGYPSIDNTIRTVKNGVADYLVKPVNLSQMEICLRRVLRERRLLVENVLLKREVEGKARLEAVNRELVSKVEQLHNINRIVTGFGSVDGSDGIFRRAVELAVEITPAEESRFFVIDEAADELFEVASFGQLHDHGPAMALVKGVALDKIPFLVPVNTPVQGLPEAVRAFMAVPMGIREKIFGVLTASSTAYDPGFSEKDLYYLNSITWNAAQSLENLALYEHIHENLFSTLYAFVKALEARDTYTQQHSDRVTEIAMIIGRAIGCSREDMDALSVAGRLHDIGKLGIPDSILLKPGSLTDEEFEKIKEHPAIGAAIVGQLGFWKREQELIRCHHERFDGNGYPDRKKGGEIPLLGRILSVADAYDAMASDRAYRRKMETATVLSIIRKGAGTQFDPDLADIFLQLHSEGKIPC